LGFSGDEVIFQKARDLNVGTWQHIVYDELIPQVFGDRFVRRFLGDYNGYKTHVNPSIQVEGTTAGFRFHNLLNLPFLHVNTSCEMVRGVVAVHPNFPVKIEEQDNCHPERFREVGAEIVLRGLLIQHAQTFDTKVTDAIRNLRLEAPGNVDVAASDIFRSRLHGLPDYDSIRQLYGLDSIYDDCSEGFMMDPLNCFRQITSNNSLAIELRKLYKKVDKIDPIVGIHSEDIPNHSVVTETAAAVELTQLRMLRDGDRFYFEDYLSGVSKAYVKSKKMSDVLTIAFPSMASEFRDNSFIVNKRHTCYVHPSDDDDD